MKIYAQKFCELTGLKPDTLRFYVDKGLLSPQIDPVNHYRTYSAQDVVDMYYARNRRALGAPIEEIKEVLSCLPLEKQLDWLKTHEQNLLDEMEQLKEQIRFCQRAQRDYSRIRDQVGRVFDQTAEEGPDLAQLNLIGPAVTDQKAACRLAARWRETFPHLLPMIHVPLEALALQGEPYPVTFGVVVSKRYLDEMPQLLESPAYMYPTHHCISTIVCLRDPFVLTSEDLWPLFDYAKAKGYRMVDSLTSWLVTKSLEADGERYYFTVRVSVD